MILFMLGFITSPILLLLYLVFVYPCVLKWKHNKRLKEYDNGRRRY